MGIRQPILYCSVCKLLVVMDICGAVTTHWVKGGVKKRVVCAGSKQPGTLHPTY